MKTHVVNRLSAGGPSPLVRGAWIEKPLRLVKIGRTRVAPRERGVD